MVKKILVVLVMGLILNGCNLELSNPLDGFEMPQIPFLGESHSSFSVTENNETHRVLIGQLSCFYLKAVSENGKLKTQTLTLTSNDGLIFTNGKNSLKVLSYEIDTIKININGIEKKLNKIK